MAWQLVGTLPGKPVDVSELEAVSKAAVVQAVQALPVPKDGVGMTGAIVDRGGHLVLTLSDGATKDVGVIVGRDGTDGANGKDVDLDVMRHQIAEAVAAIPKPADGKDGADGFGFEDFEEELDPDGRTIIHRYRSGDRVKEFRHKFSVMLYREIWREGTTYEAGDTVTWGGSLWVAKATTTAKPGTGETAWRLAVKRGQDGKDGPQGPSGKDGRPGRDGNPR